MRGLRFHLIVSGLVILLALALLVNYVHEVRVRQGFIQSSLEASFDNGLSNYQRMLEVLYANLFNRPEVTAVLARALEAGVDEQAGLRGKLYREYYSTFEHLRRNGFREFQLVLADGRSFLRFDRPDHFGDPVIRQRPMLEKVLQGGEVYSGVLENSRRYPCFQIGRAHV